MHVAHAPAHFKVSGLVWARATALALCQQPAMTVLTAPTAQTITTSKPVSGRGRQRQT